MHKRFLKEETFLEQNHVYHAEIKKIAMHRYFCFHFVFVFTVQKHERTILVIVRRE